MGRDSNIEWTDATWNPVRGCSRVSPGCVNCYAEKVAARFSGPGLAYEGLARRTLLTIKGENVTRGRWTGEVRMVPKHLADPLRWTKPRRIFVNSMSDLFHEKLARQQIAACFGVMALASHHTYQILTKRAERMRDIMSTLTLEECFDGMYAVAPEIGGVSRAKAKRIADLMRMKGIDPQDEALERFPLPWIWLGVSVEDQQRADERIPDLLATPAAVRFVSYEPALGEVVWREEWMRGRFIECPDETSDEATDPCRGCPAVPNDGMKGGDYCGAKRGPHLDWIIVGGESGHGARPFDVTRARSTVEACKAAGVPVFCKQLGAAPTMALDEAINVTVNGGEHTGISGAAGGGAITHGGLKLRSKKGGDMQEWPNDLRVREFPR